MAETSVSEGRGYIGELRKSCAHVSTRRFDISRGYLARILQVNIYFVYWQTLWC